MSSFHLSTTSMNCKPSLIALLILLLSAPVLGQEARRYIDPRSGDDEAPFSTAVLAGNTLYLGGTIGIVYEQGTFPDDPTEEARAMMENLATKLQKAEMTLDDLVYVQVFSTDFDAYYSLFNEEYRKHFSKEYPPRAFYEVTELYGGARFEIQGIAVRREAASYDLPPDGSDAK